MVMVRYDARGAAPAASEVEKGMMAKRKAYDRMDADELAKATAEFDRESIETPGRPATPTERRKFKRVRRRMGRPRIGKGATRVLVTVERDLLKGADKFAKQNGIKRAQMVAKGLRLVMDQQRRAKTG
jgi:hypothetical protein